MHADTMSMTYNWAIAKPIWIEIAQNDDAQLILYEG